MALFSVPIGTLALLLGVFWPLPPQPAPLDPTSEEDPAKAEQERRKALRRRAGVALLRLGLQVFGMGVLLGNLAAGLGGLESLGSLALLTALFALLVLIVQRSEPSRRVATLSFMAFCGLLVWNYANYRNVEVEANWSLYLALVLNWAFWRGVGRRFPVGSSTDIYVWGMDD
ncbi:MAG: hypothetical protein HC915_13090 [Anaerolineae bacterium]|nr:hypothetical protein [Anaerolineae bacterium]